MDLKKLLEDVKNNNLKIEDALEKLKDLPYEDIGYAHICLLYTSDAADD